MTALLPKIRHRRGQVRTMGAASFDKLIAGFCAVIVSLAGFMFPLITPTSAHACGFNSDCKVASGTYRIFVPKKLENTSKRPAIIYIHGLSGSAERSMQHASFIRAAKRLGFVLVGVEGLAGQWTFKNGVDRGHKRNEFKYFSQVAADLRRRFDVDPKKIVIAGFSIGASMTWYLACSHREKFAGYIPVAGTLWRPQPKRCANKIGEIYHYHGKSDPTFPLAGRRVHNKRQGDSRVTFNNMYKQDPCSAKLVEELKFRGQRCKLHRNCDGEALQFCINNSGHEVRGFYLVDGYTRIAKARGW